MQRLKMALECINQNKAKNCDPSVTHDFIILGFEFQ